MPVNAFDGLDPPSSTDTANFEARSDPFLDAFPVFQGQVNALEANVNAKEASAVSAASAASGYAATAQAAASVAASATTYVGTSNSAYDLSTGAGKVFAIVESGRAFAANDEVVVARRSDSATRAYGNVTGFTGGNLTLNITSATGPAGSASDWVIFPAAWATAEIATKEEVWAGTAGVKIITPEVNKQADDFYQTNVAEISGGSLTLSGLRGFNRYHPVTQTTLVALPANILPGKVYTLELYHLGSGAANFAVTFNENFLWGDAGTPTMPSGVNKRLVVYFQKDRNGQFIASFKRYA